MTLYLVDIMQITERIYLEASGNLSDLREHTLKKAII